MIQLYPEVQKAFHIIDFIVLFHCVRTTYFLMWTKMAITYLGNAEDVSAYKKILSSILFE